MHLIYKDLVSRDIKAHTIKIIDIVVIVRFIREKQRKLL